MKPTLSELLSTRRILVCCGAGGVGKTTTATGLALAAAREGRRVLALTIDPSKRLAETLGVERNLKAPVSLPEERLRQAGIEPPGSLETWMLDPQLIASGVVRRLAPSPESAERLMNNRIYKGVSGMVAGMQEYTAMQALYDFVQEDRYDLVILDTPPSRNALDFLDGPRRLSRFFDGRIFQLFVPSEEQGFVQRAASSLISRVLSAVFGEETFGDLQEFFNAFATIFTQLTRNASQMGEFLADPEGVAFLLVTSPSPAALTDAFFFRKKTEEMNLPFRAFILNRSQAYDLDRVYPTADLLGPAPSPAALSGLAKLQELADLEVAQVKRDQKLLRQLGEKAGDQAMAMALPNLTGGANDIASLLKIANVLVSS
ncbi:MAG: arsenic transporter [Myxococcales bacterium]|nr:arsenic transporter [Myxococcales bacterium]